MRFGPCTTTSWSGCASGRYGCSAAMPSPRWLRIDARRVQPLGLIFERGCPMTYDHAACGTGEEAIPVGHPMASDAIVDMRDARKDEALVAAAWRHLER